jgi:hypothetical protein
MGDLFGILGSIIPLAIAIFFIYVGWQLYEKADQPGWAAIIPIYNIIVMLRIIGRPWWWLILMLIPIVQIYPLIMIPIDLAKSFGKGTGFGIGLLLLGIIFYPILALGDAEYQGPAGAEGASADDTAAATT